MENYYLEIEMSNERYVDMLKEELVKVTELIPILEFEKELLEQMLREEEKII